MMQSYRRPAIVIQLNLLGSHGEHGGREDSKPGAPLCKDSGTASGRNQNGVCPCHPQKAPPQTPGRDVQILFSLAKLEDPL